MPSVSIPINSELVGELFLRTGKPQTDIGAWIENVVRDYLERTAGDEWSEAYTNWRESQGVGSMALEAGDPKGGYRWGTLWMPNGTLIRMEYKRETHLAMVKFDRIDFNGATYSPSELASKIAAGTNRNAWRDLFIKRPVDSDWCSADELRRRQKA
jgi:hypothetical protein